MRHTAVSGYLPYHKKTGVTSFGALSAVKKALGTGKVGHTGTLDKFASGLLVLLAGRALKLAPLFENCDKRYEGVVRFGAETDTLDPEGAVVAEAPPPSPEALAAVLPRFLGKIAQTPPAYSAVHIEGARAWERARRGESVEMKPRPVVIHSLELRSYAPPLAEIAVHCSKGAYIRSLARDIALAAGSRAHLSALRRIGVAGFRLEDAADETLFAEGGADCRGAVRPIDAAMFEKLGTPYITVDAETAAAMTHGKPLAPLMSGLARRGGVPAGAAGGTLGVFDEAGGFTAFLSGTDAGWKYGYVYADA